MYNEYGGNPSGFSIHNYAPIDPMAGMPGFPAGPPSHAPQQVPTAPANQNIQRSQSDHAGVGNSANVNPGERPRVSTEDMRRDYAQSAVYVPTPINNMNTGVGSLVPPPTQSASHRPPAAPAASANQRGTNQQQQSQVQFFMPQHQMQQISVSNQAHTSSQNILASLQGVAMQGNGARQPPPNNQIVQRAPGQAVLQTKNPPMPSGPPPGRHEPHPTNSGTMRVQEVPAIYVFDQGHALYDKFLIVDNQYVNLIQFVDHVTATQRRISDMARLEIRRRLPQTHPLRIASEPSQNNARPLNQNPPAPPPGNPSAPGNPRAPGQGPLGAPLHVHPHLRNQNPQIMNFPREPPPPSYLQNQWPMNGVPNGTSQEELQRYYQAHQHQMHLIQQQLAQHAAHGHQNAQQMMQFQQEQYRVHHHQQQQMQQAPQRRPEYPNHQQLPPQPQPLQAPPQRAIPAQPIQDEIAAGSRVGISADESAPPCAYSPTHSPSPVEAAETREVKPVIGIPEKSTKKKKTIEVITLDDEPLVRVKTEPREGEVSSTSDDRNINRDSNGIAEDRQPRSNPCGSLQNNTVKLEHLELARAIVERTEKINEGSSRNPNEARGSRQDEKSEEERILNKAAELVKVLLALPQEQRGDELRNLVESAVQESKVTTTELKPVKESRSRSSSPDSDIIAIRPRKKVIDDELSDDPYEADQPSTSDGPVESTSKASTSRSESNRREKRSVVYDDSDDEMPVIQKKKRGSNRKSSDEEEEWQGDDDNNSSEEEWEDDEFIEREDDEEEDDMSNFIVDDDEGEEYEDDSDQDTRRRRKESGKKEKDRSWRPRRERTPSPARTVQRSKSVNDRRRTSEAKSPTQPLSTEEKRRLRSEKTRRTREDNREKARLARLQQQNEMYARIGRRTAEMPHSSAIKEYHLTNKRDPKPTTDQREAPREKSRRDQPAPPNVNPSTHQKDNGHERFQKRTTPSASEDLDDEGVHVPAKRMAHSNSVPGPSRDRPTSSAARNRPSQRDMDVKRYAEAEAKKEKERKEYETLKKKPHPTEGERMRLMQLKSMFEPKPAPRPTTSNQATGKPSVKPSSKTSISTAPVMKNIKQEFYTAKEPQRPPTPPLLDRSQGSNFANARKSAIKSIYKYLLEGERPNPTSEAQKIELELAKKSRDAVKYQSAVRSKLADINRANKSGILEVNPNAVSHSQILSGAPKENCLVAKGRKVHVDHRKLTFEQLQPLLLPFKMSDSELETNAYPLFPAGSRVAKIAETAYTLNKKMFLDAHDLSRTCSRCQKEFKLNPDGTMIRERDICRYHHRGTNRNGKRDTFQKRYTCCNEEYNSNPGCKFSDVHVFDQLFKKALSTFVSTPPPTSPNDQRSNKSYAIDCEMVYTVSGPALARLTMVNMKKEKVLDLFIKPPTEVLDPNTEFSGLKMEDIENAKDTMESCHQKLFQLVNSETILIGHSLESDLKAMRIVHKSVIDTAILFRSSGDFKIALKNLSSRLLGKTIQGDNEDAVGHDSLEDANTCVDLIFYGLKNPDSIVIRKLSS